MHREPGLEPAAPDVLPVVQAFCEQNTIKAATMSGLGGFGAATVALGQRDGHTTGGHPLSGVVRPTLELLIEELAGEIKRTDRPHIGIPLIDH